MKQWVLLLVSALMLSAMADQASAWGECKYEREIERTVDVKEAELLDVRAGAGSLEIKGSDRKDILVKATLCSSDDEVLAKMDVSSQVAAGLAQIKTEFPGRNKNWLGNSDTQMGIDLVLEVPSSMKLDVADSSGEASISNVAWLKMVDSSGQLTIEDVSGDLSVVDSSGELKIKDIGGDALVTDSSGGLYVKNVKGDFTIDADSSGGIEIKGVGRNVLIKRDSSGSINVKNVGGDFTVGADGSGSITYDNVSGKVSLPK